MEVDTPIGWFLGFESRVVGELLGCVRWFGLDVGLDDKPWEWDG